MRLQPLCQDRFEIVAVMEGDECPTLDFLHGVQATYERSSSGLLDMLEKLAQLGFHGVPTAWCREVDKNAQIYEFKKGDLRLFYFKGAGNQIAVCTTGVVKKGQKVDKRSVAKSVACKAQYAAALKAGTLKVIDDEND